MQKTRKFYTSEKNYNFLIFMYCPHLIYNPHFSRKFKLLCSDSPRTILAKILAIFENAFPIAKN